MNKKICVITALLLAICCSSCSLFEDGDITQAPTFPTEETATTDAPTTDDATTNAPTQAGEVVTFRFAGDFTQAELGGEGVVMSIMATLDEIYGGDITQVFSDDLIELMRSADIFMLNNEYTYSLRGTPTAGKHWTFRANPKRVKNLSTLGVDIVGLANNHAFDWGEISLLDTLDTLDGEGIDHVGAGRNLAEAMKPVYYELGGKTFSFVCATAVEKVGDSEYGMSRPATEDKPGVLNTTDPANTLAAIETAKANSDYCFVYVHWGTESTTVLDEEQTDLAHAYIDAGADAIIGGHPHVLQGFEYYKGKPIIYSLGNFWFNSKERETGLLEINVDTADMGVTVRFLPCLQRDCRTVLVTKAERKQEMLEYMQSISDGINISQDGTVTEK